MGEKVIRDWKKVKETDLKYISYELKELVDIPCVIFLEGPVGAGKTTFVKNFDEKEKSLSPTYSILSEGKTLLHGDFYRIKESNEITMLELELYLNNKDYFFAEWGLKHLRNINREVPESFNYYSLEIEPFLSTEVIDESEPSEVDSGLRNFILRELSDID
ncbi:tRNA (adenosine(37)-N6)-threonylcarbamoyltransferase complex ATPase subunit type 1 TsaE [Bacteriovoracaceae bacterium]|nr:tRNA (adenosine(37)-N6)-threonylcarbamoyltransferase complex ATPase subunit type 1 TsaE [Bacteriovoracaceae bacterium]